MESIPFDPALVLGNLVDQTVLDAVVAVSKASAPADQAQQDLASLMQSKRSLDMTVQELTSLGIDPQDVIKEMVDLDKEVAKTAVDYAKSAIKAQQDIKAARAKRAAVPVSAMAESPIDYNATQIKKLPLSADSINLDVQYFTHDQNDQDATSTVSLIKSYVAGTTSFLGTSRSVQMTASAGKQASSQYTNHDVAGTLVISAGCTHKDAVLLAPLIINPDKAINVWNMLFKDDQIDTNKPSELVNSVMNASKEEAKNYMQIISGATYGSSFVGMVHVLRSETTQSDQQMYSAAAALQAQMKTGGWFAQSSGGFGVDSSFASDVKRLLSMQQISSHCSLITMGSIPSIKSNLVKIGVKEFKDFDGAAMMEKLATLQNATATDRDSVGSAADSARTGGRMIAMQAAQVKSVMTGLQDADDGQNKMLDINSLMTAFEDYVDKALAGNVGVPINYYLKRITKSALAHLWVGKYFPQYMTINEDDSAPKPAPAGGN